MDWYVANTIKKQTDAFFYNWASGSPFSMCMIVSGHSGCGKTSMVYSYEESLNLNIVKESCSLLKKSDLNRIQTFMQTEESVEEKRNVLLLDDGDRCRIWKDIEKIIESTKIPIIITANYVEDLPRIDGAMEIFLDYPSDTMKKEFLFQYVDENGLVDEVGVTDIDFIAESCKSFRGCEVALRKCLINGNFSKIDRPIEDYSMDEKILKIYSGEMSFEDIEMRDFMRVSLNNKVPFNQLQDLKELEILSRKTSLGNIPTDYMNLCRSDVKKIHRHYRKKKWIKKDKKTNDEIIEFKTKKSKKKENVAIKKDISENESMDALW